ncbi:MAG: hypothetical protein AABW85_02865 [archaeon]
MAGKLRRIVGSIRQISVALGRPSKAERARLIRKLAQLDPAANAPMAEQAAHNRRIKAALFNSSVHLALDSVGIRDKNTRSYCLLKMREFQQSSGSRRDKEIERDIEAKLGKIRNKIFFRLVELNLKNFLSDLGLSR